MNWDAVGAIGEIIGAAAFVAWLMHLATQNRIQNKESRIASAHEISTAFRDAFSGYDLERAEVWWLAMSGEELTPTQPLVVNSMAGQTLRVWEEAYFQYQEGRLDEKVARDPTDWGGKPKHKELVAKLHRTKEDIPRNGIFLDATAPLELVVDEILEKCQ